MYDEIKPVACPSIPIAISASCTLMKFVVLSVSFYAFMKRKNALIETFNSKAIGKCVKVTNYVKS
jgi:hypothetical protein